MASAEDIKFRFTAQDDLSGALKKVNSEFAQMAQNAKVGATSVVQSSKTMGKGMGSMGRNAGMAGMQVQQLVGQVQMGTNPMMALSQQAADLGFVLGAPLAGAVAGIGASIAMVLLPNLFQASRSIDDVSEAIDDLSLSYKDLTQAERELKELQLVMKLEEQETALKSLESQLNNSITAMESQRDAVNEDMYAMEMSAEAAETFRREQVLLKGDISILKREISDTTENLDYYRGATTQTAAETKKLKEETEDYIDKLKEELALFDATDAQKREFQIKQLAAGKQAEAKALSDQLKAKEEAKEAEEQLVKDKDEAMRMVQRMGYDQTTNDLKNSFVAQQALLDQYHSQNLISKEQYAMASQQLEEKMTASAVASFSSGMEALGRYNKKAFQIAKAVKTGEAIMNTYAGVTQALAAYPPPFSYIAAAGQLAFGMAQVAQIRSQSYQGKAVGGSVDAGTPYIVGERGREMFVPNQSGTIVKNSDLTGSGSSKTVNVNFNVSTVDAAGFDQLLQARKGMIVSMVNRAMNDRGRIGVTS